MIIATLFSQPFFWFHLSIFFVNFLSHTYRYYSSTFIVQVLYLYSPFFLIHDLYFAANFRHYINHLWNTSHLRISLYLLSLLILPSIQHSILLRPLYKSYASIHHNWQNTSMNDLLILAQWNFKFTNGNYINWKLKPLIPIA